MLTLLYSVLHFMVDGICAYRMYGYFLDLANYSHEILYYNFCAFALQLPLGVFYDSLAEKAIGKKKEVLPVLFTGIGVLLTIIGAVTLPFIMGIGNAFFHIGGGMGTYEEDCRKQAKGSLLGIFVAPGAIGLFLGRQLNLVASKGTPFLSIVLVSEIIFIILFLVMMFGKRKPVSNVQNETRLSFNFRVGMVIVCATLVVIIRSYVGTSISYAWKGSFITGFLATLLLALGKAAGGIASSKFGMKQTVVCSLCLAAIFYCFKDNLFSGCLAIFFFQMTMPITLYLVMKMLSKNEAMAFGLLTFGLFIGFLPEYFHGNVVENGALLGVVCSIVSLVLLVVSSHCSRMSHA